MSLVCGSSATCAGDATLRSAKAIDKLLEELNMGPLLLGWGELQGLPAGGTVDVLSARASTADSSAADGVGASEVVVDLRDAGAAHGLPWLPDTLGPCLPAGTLLRSPRMAFWESASVGPCTPGRPLVGLLHPTPRLAEQPGSERPPISLEQVLQSLLLQQGLLEDREIAAAAERLGEAGLDSSGSLCDGAMPSSRRRTLREMRRKGPLGELSEGAQTALLGGTLYAYGDAAASPSRASRDTGSPAETPKRALAAEHPVGAAAGTGLLEPSFPSSVVGGSALTTLLQQNLDRVLSISPQTTHRAWAVSGNGPCGDAGNDCWLPVSERSLLNTARSFRTASSFPASPCSGRSLAAGDLTHDGGQSSEAQAPLDAVAQPCVAASMIPLRPPDEPTEAEFEEAPATAPAAPSTSSGGALAGGGELRPLVRLWAVPASEVGSAVLEDDDDEGAVSVAGFDSSITSQIGVALGGTSPRPHGDDGGEGELSASRTLPGDALTLQGLDGELAGMLLRLAAEGLSLDEGIARSVRRVLQLGTVLTGESLTDEEIRALPKVEFDAAERQNCPICLESYLRGEFLTALPCGHFFHVDCLGRWFRRSTQCPLCRTHCTD